MNNHFAIPEFVQELSTASSHGVNQIVQKLSTLLSHPVLVVDPLYQVLSCSTGIEAIDEIVIMPDNQQESNPHFAVFSCQISTIDSLKNGLANPITLNNKILGYLILFSNDKPLAAGLYEDALIYTASLCALQMQKSLELKQERQKFKEAFLFDLLYGNIKQKEDITEYGEIWGWDFSIPHIVIVFSYKEDNHFFTNKQTVNMLLQVVENELISQNFKPIAMAKQSQVITMIPLVDTDYDENRAKLEAFAVTVLNKAAKMNPEFELACGIGKKYRNPTELFRSYQEAKVAFELGILLKITTPLFTDFGLERILYKHDLQDLIEYYNHTLGSLLEHDKNHDGNLIETLEVLAANQFDMGKTAKASFLHRNTLRYRVKRIEEILNMKLDDLHVRLDIMAAFKIKQLRKI
ncbi:Purine catabolism regulatory protein [Neobacillus rhizosphaerae]|uniref:Purine catabolism regulatory protein n=1 Tax=Neobacillus rhizosphaerae TaxID=2880965 RepID=A0ABM9EVW6_9BACI|nr:helix-turn-helix domain-containing protein [Neobacillus rhizosphaerae]CAH2716823.1 Purine catabolism regulatory protein [Neobacillus rhizosphaerae]